MTFVSHVEAVRSSSGASQPIAGLTELPSCPVCLERLDDSVNTVLTILCNHSFHSSCLEQWSDTTSVRIVNLMRDSLMHCVDMFVVVLCVATASLLSRQQITNVSSAMCERSVCLLPRKTLSIHSFLRAETCIEIDRICGFA